LVIKRKVLITGGAGFIGSNLANALIDRGHFVRVLDNLAAQIHGEKPEDSSLYRSLSEDVEFIRGCVTSRDDLMKVLPGIDTVVHLAAETGTGQSMYDIHHYTGVNVGGTALLLDLIANEKFPIKKLIVASSRAVYGEGDYSCKKDGLVFPLPRCAKNMESGDFSVHCPVCDAPADLVPTCEATPVRPSSVYGITKLSQEQMVITVGKALGVSTLAFRYQNVYGPGQSLSNPYTGILSIFSTRILNGNDINIFEDGEESRDFVYIDDAVGITVMGIEHEGEIADVFNVGAGVATDVMTIANTLQRLLGVTVPVHVSGQFRLGDIRHSVANISKAESVLDFKPIVQMEEGLHRFVEWVKGEQVQVDRYDESMDALRNKGMFK
jgi:dTDP-L-rhamnose 4-epimerase